MQAAVIAGAVAALALLASCEDTETPAYEFLVQVDSVAVAQAYVEGDSIVTRFEGTIGPDRCHRFDHFEVVDGGGDVEVRVFGRHTGERMCGTAMSYLERKRLAFAPRPSGDYGLTVHRPKGGPLTYRLTVAPPGAASGP